MTLREKQSIFVYLIARLIIFARDNGYELTFGEALRTKEQAALNAKKGIGIKNSLHIKSLAIDFNLFKDGIWLKESEDHKLLGEWWERQHSHCRWGGRWQDGNHYEFTENEWR